MQAKEDLSSARCRSSTDDASPQFQVESKGVDFRRFRHGLDPRYSVYRWDCGSYPYFKAPVPTSAAPCPGVQPAFAPNNLGYPSHVPNAPDIFCDGRGDCYGGMVVGSSGQDFVPQPQRCICPDTHEPRYHAQHLGSDALQAWEPRSTVGGCLCCGQHMPSNPHGPRRSNHHPPARHLDSSGRLFQPVYRAVVTGPDVVHVYPPSRKSIDASWSEGSAPGAQCLPPSSSPSETLCIGSGLGDQRPELRRDDCAALQLMEDKISSIKPYTESVSTENRDARRSNGERGRETGASLSERFGSDTTDTEDKNKATASTMKNIGSVTTEEAKRSDLTTGKISDAKITPTRSSSKVTPLYGLPSWWGDEPISDFDQKRKYSHPTVTSSSPSSDSPTQKKQTERSDRVPIAKTRTSLSNSNPPDATTNAGSLGPTGIPTAVYSQTPITDRVDVQALKHSQSNKDLGHYPIIFENPGLQKSDSRSPPRLRNQESQQGSLGTFKMSTFSNCSPDDFESPISVSRSLQICGHHSPPERDRPSTVDGDAPPPPLHHFLYPDPLLPLPVRRDIRLVTCGDDCGPLKCKAPTAFIVDLQEMDNDNDDEDNEDSSQRRSITVKTSLRQFLPRRCERSLQRRLSWMKQNRKPHSATERGEGSRTEQTSGGDMVATTDPRQRFRLSLQRSSSFKDSFEEAVASDAIADDVSEAGTYTIDVSSDGESVAVADARERILATFGITGIEDDELEQGEWAESGKGYFEKDSDRDGSKKDVSLKSRTSRKPATLKIDNNTVINDSRSNATEPVTPTAENYTWSFSEAFSPPPLPSTNDLPAEDDIVLTIYTESPAGCSITRSGDQQESHRMILHQDVQGPPQRPRCLDTSVLLTETNRSTLDAGQLLLEPGTMSPSCCTNTMPRHSADENCFSLGSNKAGPYLFSTSTAASESGRIVLPTDHDYFRIPASSYSGPVSSLKIGVVPAVGIFSDAEMLDPGLALRRKSSAASASGDSLESPGRTTTTASGNALSADDQMSESGTSLYSKSLLCGPVKDKEATIRTGSNGPQKSNTVVYNSCDNSVDYKSDSDEDGSSVDPLNVPVPVRTVASVATEVSPKQTDELAKVNLIVDQKSRTTRKSVEEKSQRQMNDQTTTTTKTMTMTTKIVESESPAKQTEMRDKKPRTSNTGGPKTQITSPNTDKSPASRHPKTKPPTPKSFPKSPSFPDGQLASRRCFSDLDVAGHDDASSEATASPLASEGKGIGGKGTTTSSVEHTRMNRTFALRCARREASDGTEANRSDNNPQRSARTTKKTTSSSSSKFDDAQRSRSASRSRPGGVSSRSLFESSRSADTSLNLGQRTVKKSQEIDRKTRQTTTTTDAMSRSLTRDDDSSSQKSTAAAAAFRPPNAIKTTKKKNLASDRGKEDASSEGGSGGATVKGSPVQSRPLSSSMTVPEAAVAGNEWTRRKKYNPRQSLQTEVSAKKTGGKTDGKPVPGNVDKAEAKPRNRKKVADAGGKNTTPSTPSDWTDDEKLQLTPRGRDLPAVCQLSAKVKLLSDQVLQTLRKRPEFKVNEIVLQSPKQASSDTDSLENTSPEFLYIFHNLEAAERQMSAVFKVLSTHN